LFERLVLRTLNSPDDQDGKCASALAWCAGALLPAVKRPCSF